MKGMILSLGATSVALAMLMTGCASTGSGSQDADIVNKQEIEKLNNFIKGSREAETIAKTNDKVIDSLASSSTVIYKRVGAAMREYITATQGDIAVILFSRENNFYGEYITEDKTGIELAEKYIAKLPNEVKKEWTAEKLYKVACEKRDLDKYLKFKKPENVTNDYVKKQIISGERIFKKSELAKKDVDAEESWLAKAGDDAVQLGKNLVDLVTGLTEKITAKTNDLAVLMKEPAMQKFTAEVSQLKIKMKFANEAKKQELLSEIAALAASADYKPLLDKQKQYGEELEQLKKNLDILQNGVAKQLEYTGKAVPWLIEKWRDLRALN